VVSTSGTYTKNCPYYSELSIDAAGTYYIGGVSNNNYFFKIEVVGGTAAKTEAAEPAKDQPKVAETQASPVEETAAKEPVPQDVPEAVKAGNRVTEANADGIAWSFSAFGSNVSLSNNGFEGNANDGSVRVWSTGGKGKLVPGSTDGLAFYYTEIDPKTQNFRLTATANVNTWTYSNGQEGFGLMACDRVAANGDKSTFWNNSYMASVTKVEYTIDGVKNSMKLGVGSQEKIGVTAENITEALGLADMSLFSSTMLPLETSCLALGAGTYNIVGNYTAEPAGTVSNITSFTLTLEKNNTGYFVSYTDASGNTTTRKYYDTEALSKLDGSVYVGFFASRNADVTFSDISLQITDPATDAPAEVRDAQSVDPTAIVVSGSVANSEDYILHFLSNCDGKVEVRGVTGNQVESADVKAGEKVLIPLKLASGSNVFVVRMTPAEGFRPDEFTTLSSYEPVTVEFSVDYTVNTASVVHVAPGASGAGTKESPASIYTAVNQAVPGQTIVLAPGVYAMDSKLTIERGMDGTADAMITLMTEGYEGPASERAVLDFGGKAAGMTLAADHWHLVGFDVTNSQDGQKGLQISGSFNVVEQVNAYRNGNTGIQISRYKSSDLRSEWPHDNLVLNCTSFFNADKGYEDADGFAAKLTVGEGNVFDGCIAHHNADDGWDLYAKVETGSIGKVVIRNSVAYKNGYLVDDAGAEINAGNGNGFKMGGESLSGYHTLINSIAFANKTKGIDSNSCPDIQVECSTSYDNESYNVAFYTNTAVNTDYSADGVLSYRSQVAGTENLKVKGDQDPNKVYGASNFYWDGSASVNADGAKAADDWFVSLDSAAAINGGITRNADGTINMNGFLELTDKAPEGVGARF
ncbi:MAG: hypothetical protein IJ863_08830, partial [Spirochaetales bacterium]|nr:hypothetical protein [Spirochaetales bacterium]